MKGLPRFGYIGMHGTTRLYLAIHTQLTDTGAVDPIPGFLTYNRYWERIIRSRFPSAPVALFPNFLDWLAARWSTRQSRGDQAVDETALHRACQIDKMLRRRPLRQVRSLWLETLHRCGDFLDRFKPDFMVSEVIQTLPCYATYLECRKRSIPYLQVGGSRLPGRMEFHLDESGVPFGLEVGHMPSGPALDFADDYIRAVKEARYSGPSSAKRFTSQRRTFKRSDVPKAAQHFVEQCMGGILEPTGPGFFHPFIAKLTSIQVKRSHGQTKDFKTFEAVQQVKGKKLFFPLHVTPEASTDLWAPRYADMLKTARGLLNYLPEGWTLILKEHPASVYLQRKPSEVKALRTLPRTMLISPHIPNDLLLQTCDALLVINSTLGLEAFIKDYPVITLGNPFYDLSGNTIPCDSFEQLPQALEKAHSFKPQLESTRRFIAAYYESTSIGSPANPNLFPGTLTADNIRAIADGIELRFLERRDTLQPVFPLAGSV